MIKENKKIINYELYFVHCINLIIYFCYKSLLPGSGLGIRGGYQDHEEWPHPDYQIKLYF